MLVALGLDKMSKSANRAAKESGVTQQRISILIPEENTLPVVSLSYLELTENESSNAQVLAEANKT